LLEDIGIPSLILLVCLIAVLYIFVRNFNKYSAEGEASRTKYIAVWVLVGFLTAIFGRIWTVVWITHFREAIEDPQSNLLLFLSYYAVTLVGAYYIFKITYSCFSSIVRKKTIPYSILISIFLLIWTFDLILSNFDSSASINDNAAAILLISLIHIGSILLWIRKKPGFELPITEQPKIDKKRNKPKIYPRIEIEKFESGENDKSSSTDQARVNINKNYPASPVTATGPVTVINRDIPPPSIRKLSVPNDKNFASDDEPQLKISLDAGSEVHRQHLCELLYVASKFRDTGDVLKLLTQLGFLVIQSQSQFTIKNKSGFERVIDGEDHLISFAKKLSVQ
jgi:heme/copper-type cytochrome/quinol oxidase subunit 2